jgi:hypothetical protein
MGNYNMPISNQSAFADYSIELEAIRTLAFRALRNDREANFKLHRLMKDITEGRYLIDAQVLFGLTQPEPTNRMPIASLHLANTGKLVRIDFTPGCLDFEAQNRRVSVCA